MNGHFGTEGQKETCLKKMLKFILISILGAYHTYGHSDNKDLQKISHIHVGKKSFKGGTSTAPPTPQISMFCALSQNYQHLL